MDKDKKLGLLAGTAAVFAAVVGIQSCQESVHSVEDGKDYLEQKGYSQIEGGRVDYLNSCGKDVFARSYTVVTPEGKSQDKTVCFSFNTYEPIVGN